MSLARMSMMEEVIRSHRIATIGENRLDKYNCTQSALGCMSARSGIRRCAIMIMDHRRFDQLILIVIILNCVTLAMADPTLKDIKVVQDILYVSEYVFLIVFTLEMVIKVLSLGLYFHPHAYLRGTWNKLDCLVVTTGYFQLFTLQGSNLTMLRALRICRPLRMAGKLKEIKLLMATLGSSLPLMVDVFVLLSFLVWVFAILGLQLWAGALHYRCYIPSGTRISQDLQDGMTADELANIRSRLDNKGSTLVQHLLVLNDTAVCGVGHSCHENGVTLPQECIADRSISDYGLGTFDNILEALLLVLKDASLDDWPQDMANFQNRSGHGAWVYWFFLSLLGNYFVFNLMLAVLSDSFSKEREKVPPKAPQAMKWLRCHHSLGASVLYVLQAIPMFGLSQSGTYVCLLPPGKWKNGTWVSCDLNLDSHIMVAEDDVDHDEEDDNIEKDLGGSEDSTPTSSQRATMEAQREVEQEVAMKDKGVLYTMEGRKKRLVYAMNCLNELLQNSMMENMTEDFLKVDVLEGSNLIVCDKQASDPYVVVEVDATAIAPANQKLDKYMQRKCTLAKNNTRNPVWNVSLYFPLPDGFKEFTKGEKPITVKFTVYDKDDLSSDDFMGEVTYSFTAVDNTNETPIVTRALCEAHQIATKGRDAGLGSFTFRMGLHFHERENTSNRVSVSRGRPSVHSRASLTRPRLSSLMPPSESPGSKDASENESKSKTRGISPAQISSDENEPTGDGTSCDVEEEEEREGEEQEDEDFTKVMGLKAKYLNNISAVRKSWMIAIHQRPFQLFFFMLTIVNVAVLAIDHYPENKDLSVFIEWTNFACTIGFIIEAVVKIAVMRKAYFKDNYNNFDLILVAISIPDLIPNGPNQKLNALRIFRMLRAARLVKRSPALFRVVGTIIVSLKEVAWLSLLIVLFIFIYGVLGMHLFGSRFEVDPGDEDWSLPDPYHRLERRDSFHSFTDSCISIFVVMTGEGWGSLMWLSMKNHGWLSCLYFISAFLLGNCILLNLFVAILVDNSDRCDQVYSKHKLQMESREAYVLHRIADRVGQSDVSGDDVARELKKRDSILFDEFVKEAERGERRKSRRRSSAHQVHALQLKRLQEQRNVSPALLTESLTASLAPTSSGCSTMSIMHPDEIDSDSGDVDILSEDDIENVKLLVGETPELHTECLKVLKKGRGIKFTYTPPSTNHASPVRSRTVTALHCELDQINATKAHTADALAKVENDVVCAKMASLMGYGQLAQNHILGHGGAARKIRLSNKYSEYEPVLKVAEFGRERVTNINDIMRSVKSFCEDDGDNVAELQGKSLCVFTPENCFRRFLSKIVQNNYFSSFVTFLIFINAVLISVQTPDIEDNHPELDSQLSKVDITFAILFLTECIMKIIVFGFVGTDTAYCSDKWNIVDLIVAIASLLGIFISWMKMFRSLRTIRLIVRLVEVRLMVEWLFLTISKVLNTVALLATYVVIWSILGVQLFKGQFAKCSNELVRTEANCTGTFLTNETTAFGIVTEEKEMSWQTFTYHFDNTYQAMLSLFIIAVGDGWAELMYQGVDSSAIGSGPVYNNRVYASLYFLVFVVFGQFFLMNLFVGVLIQAFVKTKEVETGACNLSDAQIHWVQAQRLLLQTPLEPLIPLPNENERTRQVCLDMATSDRMEIATTVAILVNAIFMSLTYHGEPDLLKNFLYADNVFFVIIFALEAIVKMIGLTVPYYMRDKWNRFDLLIVLISISGLGANSTNGMSVLRLFRIGRLLRLISKATGLKTLVRTMMHSLPALWNVTMLLFVVFFMFGVAGVVLFGRVNRDPYAGAILTEHNNFQNVYYALVTLYTISSTEGWVDTMRGTTVTAPHCDPNKTPSNCGVQVWAASLYFTLFMIIGSSLILNLFVTVIVEKYVDAEEANTHTDKLSILDNFRQKWRQFDPKATGMIPATDAIRILESLGTHLWDIRRDNLIRGKTTKFIETVRALEKMCIPVGCQHTPSGVKRMVRFKDVISCLAAKVYGLDQGDEYESLQLNAIEDPEIFERCGFGFDPDEEGPRVHRMGAVFDIGKLALWQVKGPHKYNELHHMVAIDLIITKLREHRNSKRERLMNKSLALRTTREELKAKLAQTEKQTLEVQHALLTIRCNVVEALHRQTINPLSSCQPLLNSPTLSTPNEPYSDMLISPPSMRLDSPPTR